MDALKIRWLLLVCLLMTFTGRIVAAQAPQAQCGVVDALRFPVDTNLFHLVQDYGAASVRHHGRYHTGEDWYGGRDTSLGQPVRAMANGRVTYVSATGWGRDGGVLILEHIFPGEEVVYSVYGHIAETDTIKFPAPFTCIREGEVIGAIGDVRPAPHVHFEIKTANPTLPGNGYTWQDPFAEGWRDPSKFIYNWQTWLHPAHEWHLDLADERGPVTPPIELDDHSLIYLDANRVGRITPDGRSLWRTVLERPAVGLLPAGNAAQIVYADGGFQFVNRDGALGESWIVSTSLDSAPIPFGGLALFHTTDQRLIAVDTAAQSIRWSLADVPPFARWYATEAALGLLTHTNELLLVAPDGTLLDRARLREGAALDLGPGGGLMAYTRGGLWRIAPHGTWTPMLESAPPGSYSGSFALSGSTYYLFDGQVLRTLDAGGAVGWEVALPEVGSLTEMRLIGNVLLLTSSYGNLIALDAASGGLCGSLRIYGDDGARLWQRLGDDGILRVAVADQIIGVDWNTFIGACA